MKKDKARDIARGVLPSTARKGARDNKRNFHAKHRHAQRQAIHAVHRSMSVVTDDGMLAHDPELFDEFNEPVIFDGYAAATKDAGLGWDDLSQNGEIIIGRRNHDKLGPLLAWAHATNRTKMVGWDNADKVNYFKAVLPDNLQGRHALGHVKDALDLRDDEFSSFAFRYRRLKPLAREDIFNGVTRHTASGKAHFALREFLYETVPVAAHATESNNKRLTTAQAVDEDGNLRFYDREEWDVSTGRIIRYAKPRPMMVDVYAPQVVTTSCDVCTFLRNDPLATPEAVKRFVDILWEGRPQPGRRFNRYSPDHTNDHDYIFKIIDYVVKR